MSFVVVGWPSADLVKRIAYVLHAPVVQISAGRFADSEWYVELGNEDQIKKQTIVYVSQFGCPMNDGQTDYSMNDYLLGVFQSIHLIKQFGAEKIIAVLPYLPYVRQEKCFCDKYAGPLALWANVFKHVGVDWMLSCDIHSPESIACMDGLLNEIQLTSFWAQYIQNMLTVAPWVNKPICLVSPDRGGYARVQAIAKLLDCPMAVIKKERIAVDKAVALTLTGDVKNRVAIIVDDILDTANTASNACKLLKDHGACGVLGCFTHAVLSLGACNRICDAGFDKILVTDTLTRINHAACPAVEVVTVSDFVAHSVNAFCNKKTV